MHYHYELHQQRARELQQQAEQARLAEAYLQHDRPMNHALRNMGQLLVEVGEALQSHAQQPNKTLYQD
ncbi:MAG: hypothetical protein ACOYLB_07305 [Phototrophicaceae bacterium]|jgi:hypothetical protein